MSPQVPPGQRPNQVPDEYAGIQVNFCRNPACENFGDPPPAAPAMLGAGAVNAYHRYGNAKSKAELVCNTCGSSHPLKSNRGIFEELLRMEAHLPSASAPSCATEGCANYGAPAPDPQRYHSYGRTKSGKPRYQCRSCRRLFSTKPRTRRSKFTDNEPWIFRHLVNKVPFRRICQLNRLHPHTLYRKIDLIHRKCLAFAGQLEAKLPGMPFERMYLSSDRQMFSTNWSSRKDRSNTILTSISTADNISRYVFGTHLNFDPTVDANAVETDAAQAGDLQKTFEARKYARILLRADQPRGSRKTPSGDRLPDYGVRIHDDYVMHAHFEFLRRLLSRCREFRIYVDPDSGLWQACLAAFHRELNEDRLELFKVRIQKNMTRPEREQTIAEAWAAFEVHLADIQARLAAGQALDDLRALGADRIIAEWEAGLVQPTKEDITEVFKRRQAMTKSDRRKAAKDDQARAVEGFVRRRMIRAAMKRLTVDANGEKWLLHPMPRLDEPRKEIWRITERSSKLSEGVIAHLYDRASLHAVDNYFQLARRNFSALERAPSTGTRGRIHYIYMPFDPMTVIRLLDIHRVHFNFIKIGQDRKTPAMRIGLADRPYTEEEILRAEPMVPFKTTKPIRPRKKQSQQQHLGPLPASLPQGIPNGLSDEVPF